MGGPSGFAGVFTGRVAQPQGIDLELGAVKDEAAPPPTLASAQLGSSLEMSARYQAQQAAGKGPQVGKPVTQNKFCGECGAPFGDRKFCTECGSKRDA